MTKELAFEILNRVRPVFSKEPNLLRLDGKVTIIGDVHGQFYDLYGILKKVFAPDKENEKLLFLGDYVDRGAYGVRIILLLFALKLKYPDRIILLRGNHESREMTEQFNFREQSMGLYDLEFYDLTMELFDQLPISAIVNGQYLCMHGGISQFLTSLGAINMIDRKMEPPADDCLLSDMLWADPAKGSEKEKDFAENDKRGMSFVFGMNPVNKILVNEGLKSIVRAHECKQEGYKFHMWNGDEEYPPVITVFSAPNYCGTHDNKAGILITEGEEINVRVFKERPDKPYLLMNNP